MHTHHRFAYRYVHLYTEAPYLREEEGNETTTEILDDGGEGGGWPPVFHLLRPSLCPLQVTVVHNPGVGCLHPARPLYSIQYLVVSCFVLRRRVIPLISRDTVRTKGHSGDNRTIYGFPPTTFVSSHGTLFSTSFHVFTSIYIFSLYSNFLCYCCTHLSFVSS